MNTYLLFFFVWFSVQGTRFCSDIDSDLNLLGCYSFSTDICLRFGGTCFLVIQGIAVFIVKPGSNIFFGRFVSGDFRRYMFVFQRMSELKFTVQGIKHIELEFCVIATCSPLEFQREVLRFHTPCQDCTENASCEFENFHKDKCVYTQVLTL